MCRVSPSERMTAMNLIHSSAGYRLPESKLFLMRTKRHLAIFTTITELHSGAPYQHKAGPLSFRRLLGVDISSDLSLDHHVSRICAGCYDRLRQLGRIRRSLDSDSLLPRSTERISSISYTA